ncbi:MAG: hypothetical protein A2Z99_17500 [Treponema sp. GWB1_62_6]|nr:MAG: hypothetical protein A2Y36_00245 [Treponema sp. GWA1_62_8]OHE72007.1 MAG: hypothetical protein A2Z99_17500 [Treponema sp. GWB1_62_6]HCM28750.1 hypothetical protein [Treponema sp.]
MVILGNAMDGSGHSMQALERARRLQEQAASVGLDWPECDTVWTRINEELAEAKAASEDISVLGSRLAARSLREGSPGKAHDSTNTLLMEELGNLLFAVVDVCRTLDVDPSLALQKANDKFQYCFTQVQRELCLEGRLIGLEAPERLKKLWTEARRSEGRPDPVPLWLAEEEEADVRGNLA